MPWWCCIKQKDGCNAAHYTFYLGTVASYPGCYPPGRLFPRLSACRRTHSVLGDGSLCHLSFVQQWAGGRVAPGILRSPQLRCRCVMSVID